MSVASTGENKYVLTITDDFTRYVKVHFIKRKAEVFSKCKKYVCMVENAFGTNVRTIRTDNGGDYVSESFPKFCIDKRIKHQSSTRIPLNRIEYQKG